MNAFQIYEAAFDRAQAEYIEDTLEYILSYAENALNVIISNEVAVLILRCRRDWLWLRAEEKTQVNFDHLVRLVLSEVEI